MKPQLIKTTNCAMCGTQTKVINHPNLDLKNVICKNHKGDDIVAFMLKEK